MNKNSAKNFSKALISASLRGLAVFAIFGMALYAYAVSYPPTVGPVSGVVGLYVGKTVATYDGAAAGSYQAANDFCANGGGALTDSHVCTPMEMINTYNHNPGGPISVETGFVWLNAGAPANTTPAVNDCAGWTTASLSFYGNLWSFDIDASGIAPCPADFAYACCK